MEIVDGWMDGWMDAPPRNRAYCPLTVSEAQREIRVYEESWDVPPR